MKGTALGKRGGGLGDICEGPGGWRVFSLSRKCGHGAWARGLSEILSKSLFFSSVQEFLKFTLVESVHMDISGMIQEKPVDKGCILTIGAQDRGLTAELWNLHREPRPPQSALLGSPELPGAESPGHRGLRWGWGGE